MSEETDSQEVVRTIGGLKTLASYNWWVGFGSGMSAILILLAILAGIGLYFNI